MDLDIRLHEIAAKPKNEEILSDLIALQEDSLAENASDIYLKTSHMLFDTYVNINDFDAATALFQNILKENRFEAFKTNLEIIDKLVALLLKTEDFLALESLLALRERYLSGGPNVQLMQKFYLSVCQEGLKRYKEAISTLESITDNISNNNLVSKYLKLAMLYLRINDHPAAYGAYNRALIFDKLKKNEMFYLVESDLAFHSENYDESLKAFQAFFLKSKVKSRYLDRYILINIKLGHLSEAWHFYKEYLPKIMRSASKNYRMQFYQAGQLLSEVVNDIDEAVLLKERLAQLNSDKEDIIDSFDGIKALLKYSSSHLLFNSTRDILLETYRVLAQLTDIDRLIYIQPIHDGLNILTYKKGLLMEKSYAYPAWQGTLIESIVNTDLDYHLFVKEDIVTQNDYLQKTPFGPDQFHHILAYKIQGHLGAEGYMVAFLAKDRHFDYVNKLLFTAQSIINQKLSMQKLLDHHESRHRLAERLLAMKEFGLFKIQDELLFMQNDAAKKLIENSNDFIKFEAFQALFVDKKLFIDDLLGKDHLDVTIKTPTGIIKKLSLDLWQIDLDIYFLAEDVTKLDHQIAELQQLAFHPLMYPLTTLHALKDALHKLKEPATLFGFWIHGLELDTLSRSELHQARLMLINAIKEAARTHQLVLALDEDHALWLLVSTTDKRVHQRIASEVLESVMIQWKTLPFIGDNVSLKIGAIIIQKDHDLPTLLDKLELIHLYSSFDSLPAYYDKILIADLNRFDVLKNQFLERLTAKLIPLRYDQVGNLITRKVEFYQARMESESLLGEYSDFLTMIHDHHFESDLFNLTAMTLLNQIAETLTLSTFDVLYGLSIPLVVLKQKSMIEDLHKRVRKAKIPTKNLVWIISEVDDLDSIQTGVSFLKEKGYKIALEACLHLVVAMKQEHYQRFDYVMFDAKHYNEESKPWFDVLIAKIKPMIIMMNVKDALSAESLKLNRLSTIQGPILANNLRFEDLKAKLH